MDGERRYMAGDIVRMEIVLVHAANLSRIFVAFSHDRDPLTELYFEATHFPAEGNGGGTDGSKRSRVVMEAAVPPETVPGVYKINRVNVFSVGGKLSRLREDHLAGIRGSSFEVVEEPAEPPAVESIEFLA